MSGVDRRAAMSPTNPLRETLKRIADAVQQSPCPLSPDAEPSGSTGAPICVCESGECMGLGPATGSRCRREEARARRDAGAGVQPSAEAIDAGARQRKMSRMDDTASILAAAYKVDAPAIHAAGVQEGRAAMLREVVEILRSFRTRPHDDAPHSPVMLEEAVWMNRAAGFIEARFPSEGTG